MPIRVVIAIVVISSTGYRPATDVPYTITQLFGASANAGGPNAGVQDTQEWTLQHQKALQFMP